MLNGPEPWGHAENAAWTWFWGRVEAAMRVSMEACEKDFARVICSSWAAIQAAHSNEAFGDAFYAEMQCSAPIQLCLFVRPKALQHSTFVQIM